MKCFGERSGQAGFKVAGYESVLTGEFNIEAPDIGDKVSRSC